MTKRFQISLAAILVFFILGLLVAIQLKNINDNNLQEYYDNQDLTGLQDKVMVIMQENDDLSSQNQKMSDLISSLGAELAGDDESLQAIVNEKKKAEVFAGLTDVSGDGLQIVVDVGTSDSIKSTTLLLLVNELRSSGALAISVNDERIVAMTEIRDTGTDNQQIVINGNAYASSSQFVIRAIYNEEDLTNGLSLISSLISQLTASNTISVAETDNISIPGLSEDSLTHSTS